MSFESWQSYLTFSNKVHSKQRYIMDDESNDFLNSIMNTCEARVKSLKAGTPVWRAQIGHDCENKPDSENKLDSDEEEFFVDERVPFSFKRMKPLSNSASEGRANPKGIPCLYVATDSKTAMSEVRPWLGSIMTIGQLKLARDIRIIDFSVVEGTTQYPYFFFSEPSIDKRVKAVWADIDLAFSNPVTASDSKSDYAPTQIISEFIKSKGYDGIAYKSSLAEGYNYALFDLDDASVVQCDIYEVSKIKFDFERVQDISSLILGVDNT
jgi:hypothetical protein